jgi:hypothetical protein
MDYAYQNGNQSYDPTGAITIYFQEARNALVVDEFIIPFVAPACLSLNISWINS